jgi:hypothetical protein
MKRKIDAWPVVERSTKLRRATGEITSNGWRGPNPQRS